MRTGNRVLLHPVVHATRRWHTTLALLTTLAVAFGAILPSRDSDGACSAPYYRLEADGDDHLVHYSEAQCSHDLAFAFEEFVEASQQALGAALPTPDSDSLYLALANDYARALVTNGSATFPAGRLQVPEVVLDYDEEPRLAYVNGDGQIHLAKHLPFASDLMQTLAHELSHLEGIRDESLADLSSLDLVATLANQGNEVASHAVSSRRQEYARWFYLDLDAVEHGPAFDEDTMRSRRILGAYVDVPASILVFAQDHGIRSFMPTTNSPVRFHLDDLFAFLSVSER